MNVLSAIFQIIPKDLTDALKLNNYSGKKYMKYLRYQKEFPRNDDQNTKPSN